MLSIRKIGGIGKTYRHLNRYRQILSVLFKFGFGGLVARLGLEHYLERGLQMLSGKEPERDEPRTRARRIRMALEELGPAYIKLGQILSTRPDLVPAELVAELSELQDNVPPRPFPEIRTILEEELGGALTTVIAAIDETPLASASIGQVYRGLLPGDVQVAVKVRRPGIQRQVEVDLEIMLHLATLMERHIAEIALHRPVRIVEEFAKTLEKELDFRREAANMKRFRQDFEGDETVHIPRVYDALSTSKVLTMAFVTGIKVSHIDKIDAAGFDRHLLTVRGADLVFKQVFLNGFFHADPHPGNIFVLPGHVICLLDFGMVGIVDHNTREHFVDLIEALANRNAPATVAALLQLTEWDTPPNLRCLERDIIDFVGYYLYRPLGEINLGDCLHNLLALAARYRMVISPDLFLMFKAFATVEGVARQLDPTVDIIRQVKPFLIKVRAERFSPERVGREAADIGRLLLKLVRQVPADLLEIGHLVRTHQLRMNITHQGLGDMLATHDRISNRIAFSIIIAALIIGSALIVISETPPFIFGISLIGIIGFLAAAVMGIWLLIAILKKGKL